MIPRRYIQSCSLHVNTALRDHPATRKLNASNDRSVNHLSPSTDPSQTDRTIMMLTQRLLYTTAWLVPVLCWNTDGESLPELRTPSITYLTFVQSTTRSASWQRHSSPRAPQPSSPTFSSHNTTSPSAVPPHGLTPTPTPLKAVSRTSGIG